MGLRQLVEGEKRRLLVGTEGLVLDAKVHGAQATYHDGVKAPLRHADGAFPRLKPPWLDRGYRGEGKGRDLM